MSRGKKNSLITVIIPTYNEENSVAWCLLSLSVQSNPHYEIVVIDDGSSDKTIQSIENLNDKVKNFRIFKQEHKGPGEARNLGAKHAKGEILVFIDADMTFDPNFLHELTKPIREGKTIGTDSQSEFLANPENFWALCWNIGRFSSAGVVSDNYKTLMVANRSNSGGIFRAILKSEFRRVGGFERGGDYTDDESLRRKLGTNATLANNAKFYHYNPSSLSEVWHRAIWIGSGRNFTGSSRSKIINIPRFLLPLSVIKGLVIGLRYNYPRFVFFKIVYDAAIWIAILRSL